MQIRLASLDDILDLVDHDLRHLREPGYEGSYSHPFPFDYLWEKDKMIKNKLDYWPREVTQVQWARSFLLLDQDKIVGHLNLKNNFEGSLHRAQLGMGIEADYRGRGFGKKMLEFAIDWAKEQPTLHWIDLTVFAHNLPARKLYASVGFKEVALYEDKVRVNGLSIDDISMSLKLIR